MGGKLFRLYLPPVVIHLLPTGSPLGEVLAAMTLRGSQEQEPEESRVARKVVLGAGKRPSGS
jgi:hypothetical protein